jgi:two-component system NtrC family sensor kinase
MPRETILIVDDSPEITHVLTNYMLVPLGYKTLHATNGKSGLKMALSHKPDLIMSDVQMPRMNGMELLTALHQADSQIPVIFMTMHGSESIAVEAFRLGVRDYIIKPFTPDEVEQAVDRALREVRLTREKEELTRNLATSEAIRQTTVTLAHYINNRLMVLTGGLTLLEESLPPQLVADPTLAEVLHNSQTSVTQIGAVLRVLQRVTKVQQTTYNGQVRMIDIKAALREELANGG